MADLFELYHNYLVQTDRPTPMVRRIVEPLREFCEGREKDEKVCNLSEGHIYKAVRNLAKKVSIGHFHPYMLRYYFGTALVEKGASLKDIQELMGHESLEMTSIFLDISGHHLAETVNLLDD